MDINSDRWEFTLCGVQGCCATIGFTTEKVSFTDDNGGEVIFTKAEWSELVDGVKAGVFPT